MEGKEKRTVRASRRRREDALLSQILILAYLFAQTQQVFRAGDIARSPRGCERLAGLPAGAFPDAEAEGLVAALLFHKIVRVVLARVVTLQSIGREVIQVQGVVAVVAFPYAEPVVPEALADTEREWPRSLRTNRLCFSFIFPFWTGDITIYRTG